MKTKITTILTVLCGLLTGQTVTTGFEAFNLPANSTYSPGSSKPFYDGGCVFRYEWDTQFSFWSGGFAYTTVHDSTHAGYSNLFGVRSLLGHNGSNAYVVAQQFSSIVPASASARVNGFFVTNTTYAYKSMKSGDSFAKKFGGAQGNDPDYFKLVCVAWRGGSKTDSVQFYLADFRQSDNTKDYILDTWQYVDLSTLGKVDSVTFILRSSDTGQFGMNTPGFFAIDDLSISVPFNTGVAETGSGNVAVYPNPASSFIEVSTEENADRISITDLTGRPVIEMQVKGNTQKVDVSGIPAGIYMMDVITASGHVQRRFIKQ